MLRRSSKSQFTHFVFCVVCGPSPWPSMISSFILIFSTSTLLRQYCRTSKFVTAEFREAMHRTNPCHNIVINRRETTRLSIKVRSPKWQYGLRRSSRGLEHFQSGSEESHRWVSQNFPATDWRSHISPSHLYWDHLDSILLQHLDNGLFVLDAEIRTSLLFPYSLFEGWLTNIDIICVVCLLLRKSVRPRRCTALITNDILQCVQ